MSKISTVLIATISSTAKVYVVGIIGFLCTKFPRGAPLLPKHLIGMASRLTFNLFTIALIYSSIASTLSMDMMKQYWFVPISGIVIITLSYVIATLSAFIPWFRLENPLDFEALRIAASFPNIVALPILIFPTLCEFDVVHQAFTTDPYNSTSTEMAKECTKNSVSLIFTYFLSWSCLFFCFGYQKLINSGKRRQDCCGQTANQANVYSGINNDNNSAFKLFLKHAKHFISGMKQAFLSPGIIGVVLAIITALIPKLQSALFSQGGALRFLGSAIQSLGDAAPALGTLLVAASLNISPEGGTSNSSSHSCPTSPPNLVEDQGDNEHLDSDEYSDVETESNETALSTITKPQNNSTSSNISDQSKRRSSFRHFSQELSKLSIRNINLTKIKPSLKMHVWFNLSRLILTPAVVLSILLTLECVTTFMSDISPLAKLVVLINAALPGAQIIVIVLKSIEATETSAIVARVYIVHYLLNAITITGWASLGLILFSPKDGNALGDTLFCPWKK